MKLPLSFVFSVAILIGSAAAQPAFGLRPAPDRVLQGLQVREATLQDLSVPGDLPGRFVVRVFLANAVQTLRLEAYDVRSHDFRLLVEDGNGIRSLPTPPAVTYRGAVDGRPESVVAASLVAGQLQAVVLLDETSLWAIQPASALDPQLAPNVHVVYTSAASLPIDARCGNREVAVGSPGHEPGPLAMKQAEIACDADYDYYVRYGSNTTNTQNQVTTVINAVDAIYKRDVEITYTITAILVRTSRTYTNTDMTLLLPEFGNRWNSNHGSIRRDLAHLFTGKGSFSGVIGIAYLGVVCNVGSAYATSKAFSSSLTTNAGLVAHEVGHNWNAPHCDTTSPCNIMCSGLGGCSRNITSFAAYSKSVITSFKNSRPCLSDTTPPQLTGISPNQIQAYRGSRVTLTGTALSGVTAVDVGTVRLTSSQFGILSDTTLWFEGLSPAALGPQQVTVSNGSGKSNGLTLTVVETRPPLLDVISFALTNYPLDFDFGAGSQAIWVLLVSPDATTFKFLGDDILLNFLPLTAGQLNSVGIGKFSVVPPTILSTKRLYWQLATLKGPGYDGASTVLSTLFL